MFFMFIFFSSIFTNCSLHSKKMISAYVISQHCCFVSTVFLSLSSFYTFFSIILFLLQLCSSSFLTFSSLVPSSLFFTFSSLFFFILHYFSHCPHHFSHFPSWSPHHFSHFPSWSSSFLACSLFILITCDSLCLAFCFPVTYHFSFSLLLFLIIFRISSLVSYYFSCFPLLFLIISPVLLSCFSSFLTFSSLLFIHHFTHIVLCEFPKGLGSLLYKKVSTVHAAMHVAWTLFKNNYFSYDSQS